MKGRKEQVVEGQEVRLSNQHNSAPLTKPPAAFPHSLKKFSLFGAAMYTQSLN